MKTLFVIISALGLLSALGSVLARNLVHAALFLGAFFFVVAAQFVLLEAEFLAAIQVLIYIGAVAILFLFGIMLTRNIQGDETTRSRGLTRALAALISAGVLAILVVGINQPNRSDEGVVLSQSPEEASDQESISKPFGSGGRTSWITIMARPGHPGADTRQTPERDRAIRDMGKAVGDEMMTRFVLPFEIAGLLLTVALVGAVAIARHAGGEEPPHRAAVAATGPRAADGTSNGAVGDGQAPLHAPDLVQASPPSPT